jgi:transcriptional regulator, LacI family
MTKRLTILDIAKLSGVGKSTVSRVLNQDPNVNPQTRDRVEAVIREHGFEPSKSARAMRTNSARLVGIIVSRLDSASENRAVRGMLEILYARGYDAMLMESEFDPQKVDEHLALLARRGVDGVILFAFSALDLEQLRPWQDKLVLMAAIGHRWPRFVMTIKVRLSRSCNSCMPMAVATSTLSAWILAMRPPEPCVCKPTSNFVLNNNCLAVT